MSLISSAERLLAGKRSNALLSNAADSFSLIAIMLGRLEMDVESSIKAYTRLMGDVFGKRNKKIDWHLDIKGQFSSAALEKAIKSMIPIQENPEQALLNDSKSKQRPCKAYV